jgi:integrase
VPERAHLHEAEGVTIVKGNITRRGKKSWRLKFDIGRDEATGERNIQYHTVKGTRQDAERKLRELLAAVDNSTYVEPSKLTVAEHVRARVAQWAAASDISPKTAERYQDLTENQIVPFLGAKPMQKLRAPDIEAWHTSLRTSGRRDGKGGVSARTIRFAHSLLSKCLDEAVRHELAVRNVALVQKPGAGGDEAKEMVILTAEQQQTVLGGLRGKPLYPLVVTALYSGIRRGELLALRWGNVDLDGKVIRVRESLEETEAHGRRFKTPKTKAGRRDITLPDVIVETLRDHRRQQLEHRLALGLGKLPDDALVFPTIDGGPQSPNEVSKKWAAVADDFGFPDVTLHGLRHTHASQLIDAGVDIVTISKRLGHAKPNVTLQVYAHLFRTSDDKAATAINTALASLGQS